MDFSINIKEIFTAFMVLFAVIDITGSTPIIIGLNSAGKKVNAEKAAGISLVIFITFLFAGDGLLKLFNIDISSFALAGTGRRDDIQYRNLSKRRSGRIGDNRPGYLPADCRSRSLGHDLNPQSGMQRVQHHHRHPPQHDCRVRRLT